MIRGGPKLPERIGAYRILGRLGRGGIGEVMLAYDGVNNRKVAIKRLRSDGQIARRMAENPRAADVERERLRREARATARLRHPAIVEVLEVVSDATGDHVVMEYVEGGTVHRRIREGGPFAVGEALRVGREICEGLAAAHEAGVIHRDLKAENVMIDGQGRVKILDFGLVKNLPPFEDTKSLTETGMLVGTARIMSPEQATGRGVDERSDLFSLGVLLYEMLTGRSPFRRDNLAETLQRVVRHQPPPVRELRPEVPAELSELVGQLLEKKPDRRPQSAGQVARDLKWIALVVDSSAGT